MRNLLTLLILCLTAPVALSKSLGENDSNNTKNSVTIGLGTYAIGIFGAKDKQGASVDEIKVQGLGASIAYDRKFTEYFGGQIYGAMNSAMSILNSPGPDSNILGLMATGNYPLTPKLKIFGKFGLGYLMIKERFNYFGTQLVVKSSTSIGPMIGFGVGYQINPQFEVSLGYTGIITSQYIDTSFPKSQRGNAILGLTALSVSYYF